MRIHTPDIVIERRHLAYVPSALAGALAVALFILDAGWWAFLLVVGTWLVAGLLLAAGDSVVTWIRKRREDRRIEAAISVHPSTPGPYGTGGFSMDLGSALAKDRPQHARRRLPALNRKGAAA